MKPVINMHHLETRILRILAFLEEPLKIRLKIVIETIKINVVTAFS